MKLKQATRRMATKIIPNWFLRIETKTWTTKCKTAPGERESERGRQSQKLA